MVTRENRHHAKQHLRLPTFDIDLHRIDPGQALLCHRLVNADQGYDRFALAHPVDDQRVFALIVRVQEQTGRSGARPSAGRDQGQVREPIAAGHVGEDLGIPRLGLEGQDPTLRTPTRSDQAVKSDVGADIQDVHVRTAQQPTPAGYRTRLVDP